jgi:threonine aldolase
MRQAGVLAAAGLVALEKMPARLKQDHDNARLLAEGLAKIPNIKIDPKKAPTNILVFDVSATGMDAPTFNQSLATHNVLANAINLDEMRFVTHYDVSREDCLKTLEVVREICVAADSRR